MTSRPGFTLLEAVVALAIVSLVAVSALETFGSQLRTAARIVELSPLPELARERLTAVSLLSPADLEHLPDSIATGTFAAPFAKYTWKMKATRTRNERDLFDVAVSIGTIDDHGQTARMAEQLYEVRTRLYRPALRIPINGR